MLIKWAPEAFTHIEPVFIQRLYRYWPCRCHICYYMILHLSSSPKTKVAQASEIFVHKGQGLVYPAYQNYRWRRKDPGLPQPWYWPSYPWWFQFQQQKGLKAWDKVISCGKAGSWPTEEMQRMKTQVLRPSKWHLDQTNGTERLVKRTQTHS